MTHIEAMAYINAPSEEAWKVLSDIGRFPEWIANLGKILRSGDGTVAPGAAFKQEFKIVGPWNPVVGWRAARVDPPNAQVFEGNGAGLNRGTITVALDTVPTGTQFLISVDLDYKPYMRPLAALVLEILFLRRTMETRLRRTADAAKAIVEGRPAKVFVT